MKSKSQETKIGILLIYLIAVAIYTFIASKMSVPVHLNVDEELYLAMAKSFHKSGEFMKGYEYLNYNCVLYSMLISVAYYFYTPGTILFTVRAIGVLVMCSAVFPVYLLARRILPYKKAIMIAFFSLLIPDMIDSCYIMQEVLLYPVLMWCFYFSYMDISKNKICSKYTVLNSIFMALAFFIKTNALVLIVAYVAQLMISNKKRMAIHKSLIVGSIWGSVAVIMYLIVFSANGGAVGTNHYASQIMCLFPITMQTIIAGVNGLVYYFVFFTFCVGILPMVLPIEYRSYYSDQERKFFRLIYITIILLIIEIVVTIFLTEEAGNIWPHKFLFRYFFCLGIPLFIATLKLSEYKLKWNKKIILTLFYFGIGIYAIIYYSIIQSATRTAIMDSHITLLIENVNKHVLPGFVVPFLVVAIVLFLLILNWFYKKYSPEFWIDCFCKVSFSCACVFLVINSWQHPYYSNIIAEGNRNEHSFIELAEYLGKEDVEVYYLNDSLDNTALFYGYIWQDYKHIEDMDELLGRDLTDSIIVTIKDKYDVVEGYQKLELNSDTLDLWQYQEQNVQ